MPFGRSATLALATVALFVFAAATVAAHPPEPEEPVAVERLNLISVEEGGLALDENASRTSSGQAIYEFESENGLPCCSWWYGYGEPVEEPLPLASDDFRLPDEIGVIEGALAVEWAVDDVVLPMNVWGEEWYLVVELVMDVACDTYRAGFEITEREGNATFPLELYGEHEHDEYHGGHGEACVAPQETWAHDVTATLYIYPVRDYSPEDMVFDEYIRIAVDTAGDSFVELPVVEPQPPVPEESVEPSEPAIEPAGNGSASPAAEEDEVVMQVPAPGLVPFLLGALAAVGILRRRQL